MQRTSAPEKLKRAICNAVASLNIIRHVTVTWDSQRNLIYIKNEFAFCPDFELKYSETYNMYHAYIYVKSRDTDEKAKAGYTFMRVDSSLAAVDFLNVVQTIYRRRPGPNWSSEETQ